MSGGDARRSAPHVARNAGPIGDVLETLLPPAGRVLELASGTGEHGLAFARRFPELVFQPSDRDPENLASIEAWRAGSGVANLKPPLLIDVESRDWSVARADAILCINMIHISPWSATEGLMRGAGRLLSPGAPLYLYGAYRQDGVDTAPSNEAFDASLRARDPAWGLRRVEDLAGEGARHGLALQRVVPMPANNLSLVFVKAVSAD